MNQTYRLVWNECAGAWVAVSELARGRTKRAGRSIAVVAVLLAGQGLAWAQSAPPPNALPTGGAITAGSGSIVRNGNTLTISQGSDKLVANWSTFNIGSDATVRFAQPGAGSAALNRIGDTQPSQIFGKLTSNGQVFLLNPAGIVFGRTARVDVGALVASSLALSDQSFLSGKYQFTNGNGAGAVINEGTIRANGGVVAFIAPQVRNSGTIVATGGTVAAAAGDKIALDFSGNGLTRLNVDKAAFDALVENHGLIQADGGMVIMTAKTANALVATVVNTGTIEARTLGERAGRILLLADMEHGVTQVGGRLDASAPDGGNGGFIETSGARVKVADSAVITTAAPKGAIGRWLVDPTDIVVAASGGDVATATLDASASTVTLQASHDVTFSDPVAMTQPGAGLTVQAGNNINVNAAISTNGGAINLSANDASGPASGSGALFVNAPLTANGANIALAGASVSTAVGGDLMTNGSGAVSVTTQVGGASTLSGNIASGGMISVDDGGGSVLISGAIGSGAGLTKNGTGMLTLGGGNAYGGATSVNAGTLRASSSSALPAATSVTVASGAALDLPVSQTVASLDLSGSLSGSGILSASNAYLRNGSVVFGNLGPGYVNVTGAVALNGTVNSNQIAVNGGATLTLGSPGRISAATIVQDYGTLVLGGAETFGTLFGTGTINLGPNMLTLGASGNSWQFDGAFVGTGQVAVAPGATVYLAGTSSHSGGTSIGTGAYLVANSSAAMGTGTIDVGAGTLQVNGVSLGNAVTVAGGTIAASGAAVLDGALTTSGATRLQPYSPGDSLTFNGPAGGPGTITKIGQGPVTFTGGNNWTGGTSVQQGTLFVRDTVLPAGSVSINSGATLEFDDTVGATRQLQAGTYSGTGTLRFTGAAGSSYGMGGSGTVSMALSQGALIDLGGLVSFSGSLAGQGNWASNQGSLAIASGATFDSVEGFVRVDGLSGAGTLQGGYGGTGSVTVGVANATTTFTGLVQDSPVGGGAPRILNLAKTGFGTFTLAGPANTFTGTLDVQSGWLRASSAGALGSAATAATVHSGATLDLAFAGGTGKGVTLSGGTLRASAGSGITSVGTISANTAAATLEATGGSTLQAAGIADTGVGVLFRGPGNFDASGTNSLGTIAATGVGNLSVRNGNPLIVGSVAGFNGISATGTVQLDAGVGSIVQNSGATITAGTLVLTGAAAVSLTDTGNSVGVLAANVGGSLGYVNNGALTLAAGNGVTGITAAGPVSIATTAGNLTVAQNVASADTGSAAVVLNAGSFSAPGTGLASNVVLSGAPAITTGAGGRATVYTGSVSGSTGVASLVGAGSGHFRYGSSQSATNFSTALGAGLYAVYREQPTAMVTAANGSTVYGTAFVGSTSVSGGLNGDTAAGIFSGPVIVGGAVSSAGFAVAGSHALTPSVGGISALGYALGATQGTLTVNAASLSVASVTVQNKIYDGGTGAAITGIGFSGLAAGDQVGLGGGLAAFSDKNAGAGKPVAVSALAIAGADAANYVLATPTASTSATITPRQITAVSGITGNKVYDGTTADPLVTTGAFFANEVGGDALTVATATGSFASKTAGTNKPVSITGLSLGGADAGNYTLASSTATINANITPATVTLGGITAANKVYDATVAATLSTAGATFAGRIGGDVLTVASATGNFSDRNAAANKTVNVFGLSLGGADAANYTLSATSLATTATITPRPLTFNVTASDKTYDGSIGTFQNQVQIAFGNLVPGDAWQYVYTGAQYADKNVGTAKTVTVSGIAFTGVNAGNYTIPGSTATTTSSILPRQITAVTGITATDKVYDGTTAAVLVTGGAAFANAVASDNLTVAGATGAFGDKNAGAGKPVGVSGLTLGGTDAGNYVLASTTAATTAAITPRPLAVDGLSAANKVYDATTAANLLGTAAVAALAGDVVSLAGTGNASFADKNVGTGKSVSVNGYTLTGTDAGNYTLVPPAGLTADITQAALAITGVSALNKTYDATTVASLAGTPSVAALGSDVVGVIGTGNASFADKNVGAGKTVSVAGYTLTGADAGNYTLVPPTGLAADITQAALAISGVSALNKTYDATTVASLAGTPNVAALGSDVVGVGGTGNASFADKNVGIGKAVNVDGYTLTGADAGNYTLVPPTGLKAAISPAALAITGVSALNKTYDGTTVASLAGTPTVAALGSDVVGVGGAGNASFADKNVGTGKPVSVDGYMLTGTDAGNYTLAPPTGLKGDITQAALAILGVSALNKAYDGTTVAPLAGTPIVAALGGDVVGVGGTGTGSFADAAVGTGKGVTASGYTLTGQDAANYAVTQPVNLRANIVAVGEPVVNVPASTVAAVVASFNLPKVMSATTVTPLTTTEPRSLIATAPAQAPVADGASDPVGTPAAAGTVDGDTPPQASAPARDQADAPASAPAPVPAEAPTPATAAAPAATPVTAAAAPPARAPATAPVAAQTAPAARSTTAPTRAKPAPVVAVRPQLGAPRQPFPPALPPALAKFGAAVPDVVGRKNPLLAESKVLPRQPEQDFRAAPRDELSESFDSLPTASNASPMPKKPRAVTLYTESLEALNFLNLLTLKILP